jgi:hypothetical protein
MTGMSAKEQITFPIDAEDDLGNHFKAVITVDVDELRSALNGIGFDLKRIE